MPLTHTTRGCTGERSISLPRKRVSLHAHLAFTHLLLTALVMISMTCLLCFIEPIMIVQLTGIKLPPLLTFKPSTKLCIQFFINVDYSSRVLKTSDLFASFLNSLISTKSGIMGSSTRLIKTGDGAGVLFGTLTIIFPHP